MTALRERRGRLPCAARAHAGHTARAGSGMLDQVGLGEQGRARWWTPLPMATCAGSRSRGQLATRPKLLLLDEPFAGLGVGEIEPLAALIRKLHRSEGLTILIIEHKLREFMQLVAARHRDGFRRDHRDRRSRRDRAPSACGRGLYRPQRRLSGAKHRYRPERAWHCLKSRT